MPELSKLRARAREDGTIPVAQPISTEAMLAKMDRGGAVPLALPQRPMCQCGAVVAAIERLTDEINGLRHALQALVAHFVGQGGDDGTI